MVTNFQLHDTQFYLTTLISPIHYEVEILQKARNQHGKNETDKKQEGKESKKGNYLIFSLFVNVYLFLSII